MFSTSDLFETKVQKIRHILAQDKSIALNMAFFLFNWTIKRIILATSTTPSIILRENLKKVIDPASLKALWKKEMSDRFDFPSITKVISNWELIKKTYAIIEKMELGQCSNCESEIEEIVETIIVTCRDLNEFCKKNRIQIYEKISTKNFRYVKVI